MGSICVGAMDLSRDMSTGSRVLNGRWPVYLYSEFVRVQKQKDLQCFDLYAAFIGQIERTFASSMLPEIVIRSLTGFSIICEKVFSLNTPEK